MYMSEKLGSPIDFYKGEDRNMMIEVSSNGDLPPPHQIILGDSSGDAPKKRAETWVQEETRSLISFRSEVDSLFNTSKSNKHLWQQISAKMRDKGFDRSPTMCTDKWRNLLKEFKKVKHHHHHHHHQDRGTSSASSKMLYYKELEDLLRDRSKNGPYKTTPPTPSKVDAFIHFSDKGTGGNAEVCGGSSVRFNALPALNINKVLRMEISHLDQLKLLERWDWLKQDRVEFRRKSDLGRRLANGRPTVNVERSLDHDGDPLAITSADAIAASGVPPWNWRETTGNGGRVITVKWGEYVRRIGIDGTAEAIKEAIKSAFGLRTKRAFWLEDEDNVIRSLDRDMPIGNYTLHLDDGILIKVCLYDEPDRMAVRTEEKTFYSEDDFRDFLSHRGLIGLREIDEYRLLDNLDDLRPGAMYQGVRLLGGLEELVS